VKTLTDPISKKPFKPTAASPRSDTKYGIFLFANAADKTAFDKDPAKYALYNK